MRAAGALILAGCATAGSEEGPILYDGGTSPGQSGSWERVVKAEDARATAPTPTARAAKAGPAAAAKAPPAPPTPKQRVKPSPAVAMQEAITHARILLLRGRAQLDSGDYRAAAASFDRILQLADNAPSQPELAELREDARRGWFEARAGLGLGGGDDAELPHLTLARADIRRHLKRGSRLFDLGLYGGCIANMQRVLEIVQENPGLLKTQAMEEEARRFIEVARSLMPGR